MKIHKIIINHFRKVNGSLLLAVFFICHLLMALSFNIAGEKGMSMGEALAKNSDETRPVIHLEELEKRIHDLVNQERKRQGLNSLDWNPELSRIARLHSKDMASRNYFSHETPEGRDFNKRYTQQGFSCRIAAGIGRYTLGGENLFQNNLCRSITYVKSAGAVRTAYSWNSSEQIARSTVLGWMKSPAHRKNILQPYWKTEGIGISISSDDKIVITQNFC